MKVVLYETLDIDMRQEIDRALSTDDVTSHIYANGQTLLVIKGRAYFEGRLVVKAGEIPEDIGLMPTDWSFMSLPKAFRHAITMYKTGHLMECSGKDVLCINGVSRKAFFNGLEVTGIPWDR